MKILIVEDDFTSRKLLHVFLAPVGECHIAVNGKEAVDAFLQALEEGKPYSLICLDIMMPEMDGQTALKKIREIEQGKGVPPHKEVKVIMTTALDTPRDVVEAFYRSGCTSYLIKPIERRALIREVRAFWP